MAQGGARARSGPPPDPNALRRDRTGDAEWTRLPAEGREGPTPEFPLPDATERELEVWADRWASPQAVMWERAQMHHQVALYVRRLVQAEDPGAPINLGTLVKQLAEDLGDSMTGQLRHRWRVVADEVLERRVKKATKRTASARDRMRSVADGS